MTTAARRDLIASGGRGWKRAPGARRLLPFIRRHPMRLALAAVLALGLGLRIAQYLAEPRPLAGAGLAAEQGEMARNIVDHGEWFVLNERAYELLKQRQADEQELVDPARVDFSRVDRVSETEPVVDQMPGLASILAAMWWVTGTKTYAPIQWLQILLDSGMVAAVYWIAARLTGRSALALFAGLLYAIWPKAILFAPRPLLDTWAPFFTIACVAAYVWARERPEHRRRLVLLGILTGIGVYFRPFVILLPGLLALAAPPHGGWRRRFAWIVAPTAIALLLLSPWTIRNYVEFDRFIPARAGLGQAVFQGTGRASSDEGSRTYVEQRSRARYGSPSYDEVLLKSAWQGITEDPWAYARRVGDRAARYLLPCLLVLLAWRRWRSAALVPVAAVVATVVPYLLVGDDRRFYLPAFFGYFILLAMATDVVVTRVRRSAPILSTRPDAKNSSAKIASLPSPRAALVRRMNAHRRTGSK